MIVDLDGMAVFVAVTEAQGFRAVGDRLGVSGAAVSQALRRLEARLRVAGRGKQVHVESNPLGAIGLVGGCLLALIEIPAIRRYP
jgi:hypothetical protein